jgi:hypothetical protein
MVRELAERHGTAFRSLAAFAGVLATAAAVAIGAVLAVFFAATVLVIAVMSSILLYLASVATRARRSARTAMRDDGLIEARHQGGHHWVAYGWNERS